MASTFWNYTIWYILLGVFSVTQIFIALKRAKNRKHVIALFLIIAGMTFSFEAIIYLFLKAYNYYPMIIPHSPIDDGLAGNLFSQFSVTSSAIFISVLNLKYYWFFIFSLIYGIIEELFLRLGIYSQNWYQTWMTMTGLIFLFWLTKRIYSRRLIYVSSFWRYFFMIFGLYTLHMPTILWTFILSGILVLNTKILPDAMSSYGLICILNLTLISITCMVIYFSKLKWSWKSILALALYGMLYLAHRLTIFDVKDGFFLIFATINIIGMYLDVFILDRLIVKTEQQNNLNEI